MKTVTANLFAFSMYAKQGRLLGTLTASLNINFTLFYTFPMFLLSKIGGYPSPQAKKVQLFLKFFAKKASLERYFCTFFSSNFENTYYTNTTTQVKRQVCIFVGWNVGRVSVSDSCQLPQCRSMHGPEV